MIDVGKSSPDLVNDWQEMAEVGTSWSKIIDVGRSWPVFACRQEGRTWKVLPLPSCPAKGQGLIRTHGAQRDDECGPNGLRHGDKIIWGKMAVFQAVQPDNR